MNVLSLFGGIEVGYVACKELGFEIENYFSSEICSNATAVTKDNHPSIVHLGDCTKIRCAELPKIDVLLAGFPCQTVSLANRGGQDINSGKSALVFELYRIYKELKVLNPNLKFLIENVKMSQSNQDVVSDLFGVQPHLINSSKFSIQNRKRLYWTNIDFDLDIEDKGILLRDNFDKVYDDSLVLRGKGLNKLDRPRNRAISVYSDKCPTLMKSQDKLPTDAIVFEQDGVYRYPTRRECELMQSLPENYTKAVNYRVATGLLGNAWNKDTVKHILSGLCKQE
jgi:site-specific DNA-cytosine methylase